MVITIIICVTVIILAIIAAIVYWLYLRNLEHKRLSETPKEEPKDNRIYLDRLQLLQRRYEQVATQCYLEDENIPEELRNLLSLIEVITNRLY